MTVTGALTTAAALSIDSKDNGALPAPVSDVDGGALESQPYAGVQALAENLSPPSMIN